MGGEGIVWGWGERGKGVRGRVVVGGGCDVGEGE